MKQDFSFEDFEKNYKKQVENMTPDLWSRIEDGISASEAKQAHTQILDKNYFNQPPIVQPSNKTYTKKILALAASVCFIVAAGFAISMSGIFNTDFKSMDYIQSADKYAPSENNSFSGGTNINTNKNEALLPDYSDMNADSNIDAELNEVPEGSIQNNIEDALPSESKTYTITILQIELQNGLQIEEDIESDAEPNDTAENSMIWNMTASTTDEMVSNELISNESVTINILVSDKDIDAFEVGNTYEVVLEKDTNSEWYYLKGLEDE